MSSAWSWFVIALVVLNVAGCVWLLMATSRRRAGPASETTGHVWDENLTEYNKPLPRWWIVMFYLTIVFSIGYLVYYPGMGNFAGTSGWTSTGEHDAQRDAAEARLAQTFSRFEGRSPTELAHDADAVGYGRAIFANTCATCHGADARGAKGFPNLANAAWQWGGDADTVLATILHGRTAVMPPLGAALGSERAVAETAVYVQSLSGGKADAAMAAAGKTHYQTLCVACHGREGKGNPALGAPDLTDDEWLYGGDFDTLRATIAHGRNGQMPAHAPLIGDTRARLVAAWVLSLQRDDVAQAAGEP